ncbi:hypothetical protein A6C57_23525 [Fibrella sp. ES10-3-2-2]|nr:hypothetical protein A6C57_23525 [Fibrella sp. ES10-3-2-2]
MKTKTYYIWQSPAAWFIEASKKKPHTLAVFRYIAKGVPTDKPLTLRDGVSAGDVVQTTGGKTVEIVSIANV